MTNSVFAIERYDEYDELKTFDRLFTSQGKADSVAKALNEGLEEVRKLTPEEGPWKTTEGYLWHSYEMNVDEGDDETYLPVISQLVFFNRFTGKFERNLMQEVTVSLASESVPDKRVEKPVGSSTYYSATVYGRTAAEVEEAVASAVVELTALSEQKID